MKVVRRARWSLPGFLLAACSGGGGASAPAPLQLALEFTRLDQAGLDPFAVTVTATRGGAPQTGLALAVTTSRGALGAVGELGDGRYSFVVTPVATGEHEVRVTADGAEVTRTALVLADVASGWDQPMAVPGLVNTAGYEDGCAVSPDGEYVFVHTGPVYWTGFQVFRTPRAQGGAGGNRLVPTEFHHPYMDDLIGPMTAPERPGFFTARFANGHQLHNAVAWGVGPNESPVFALSTMRYSFRRQPDGSYGEPFWLAFDDQGDALVTPYGLTMRDLGNGQTRLVFSLGVPAAEDQQLVDVQGDGFGGADDVRSGTDLWTCDVALGQDTVLGTFAPTGTPATPPRMQGAFLAQPVGLGDVGTAGVFGTQGNPCLYEANGHTLLFTDDEYDQDADSGELVVYEQQSGTWPGGTWTKTLLPLPVNTSGEGEIQPWFTGDGLYWSRTSGPDLWHATYSGAATAANLANPTNWGTPQRVLANDTVPQIGACLGIGQPTICTRDGARWLYFTYAVVRGYDDSGPTTFYDLDFQAGFVRVR